MRCSFLEGGVANLPAPQPSTDKPVGCVPLAVYGGDLDAGSVDLPDVHPGEACDGDGG